MSPRHTGGDKCARNAEKDNKVQYTTNYMLRIQMPSW